MFLFSNSKYFLWMTVNDLPGWQRTVLHKDSIPHFLLTMLVLLLLFPATEAYPASANENSMTRVTAGQQVLYTFAEGSGDTVHDVSGVGSPLDLKIANTAATRWVAGGLAVRSATLIASAGKATKVSEAIKASGALTLEAWHKPANTTQSGPARIVTLSRDPYQRDFTLAQNGSAYDVRLRTTTTSNNGMPSLATPASKLTTKLTHVVYTRDAKGNAKLYLDGVEQANAAVKGHLGNWATSYRLALANELTENRPWLGELQLVAIYDRALNSNEILQNFTVGLNYSGDNGVNVGNDNSSDAGTENGGTDNSGNSNGDHTDNSEGGDSKPIAVSNTITTDKNTSININVLANDRYHNEGPITLTVISGPSNGTASVKSNNMISYVPRTNYVGQDSFIYQIKDTNGNASMANVSITVVCSTCATDVLLTLTWNPNPVQVLGYRVYYGSSPNNATKLLSDLNVDLGEINAQSPSVRYKAGQDLKMSAGDTMCFRLQAYNFAGKSDFSEPVCKTISQ